MSRGELPVYFGMLQISDNRRFLCYDDGRPFFYLGDTAWELFHRLNREEADFYLADRAAKGFTVIQAVVLAEMDGLNAPNPYGHGPLIDCDSSKPNDAYFEHVDWIVDRAAAYGLHVGMLPCWGDQWNRKWGVGPQIFTVENARAYTRYLGQRYSGRPIIWILGGDRTVDNDAHRQIIREMAGGLREGGARQLISFHPQGGECSAKYFHEEDWLDFNMWQSGHKRNTANYNLIAQTWALSPTKPCMDAEPGYEDHPSGFNLDNGYLEDYDVRKAAYWAVFAGAHGHTYGCHPIWQMWQPGRRMATFCRRSWREAMALPGSGQMRHLKSLMLSRPFFNRIPDQTLIVVPAAPAAPPAGNPPAGNAEPAAPIDPAGQGSHHVQATRDADGSWAMIYIPSTRAVRIDTGRISGGDITGHWYNPRTGAALRIGVVDRGPGVELSAPQGGPDWVLVLDDASRAFPAPGHGGR